MNIGFVSYWFPRGQSYVTRGLISIIKKHTKDEIFLLSRRGHLTYTSGEWKFDNLTIGPKEHNIPIDIYKKWISENKIETVFFFQNYQFDEIEAIKKMGVKTVGTFMWEQFEKKHVNCAKKSYSHIYVLHNAQHKHMMNMGLKTDFLRWGVFPTSVISSKPKYHDKIIVLIPNGYNTKRKNIEVIKRVIKKIKRDDIIFKIMSNKKTDISLKNVEVIDIKFESQIGFLKHCSEADIYLIPSLWEGLGFALYEAHGLGKGIITPNYPPMSDHVNVGENGILIDLKDSSITKTGIREASIDSDHLIKELNALTKKKCLSYSSSSANMLKKYSWENTEADFLNFLKKIKNI